MNLLYQRMKWLLTCYSVRYHLCCVVCDAQWIGRQGMIVPNKEYYGDVRRRNVGERKIRRKKEQNEKKDMIKMTSWWACGGSWSLKKSCLISTTSQYQSLWIQTRSLVIMQGKKVRSLTMNSNNCYSQYHLRYQEVCCMWMDWILNLISRSVYLN